MMGTQLQWNEIYCFQKLFPLVTRWQLHHLCNGSKRPPLYGSVTPDFIKKKRTPKGVPSYEIVWKHNEKHFDLLIPDEQIDLYRLNHKENDPIAVLQSLWSSIEPIDLVEKAYPEMVERFVQSKSKRTTKKAKKTAETSTEPVKVTRKRAAKKDISIISESGTSSEQPQKNTKNNSKKSKKPKKNENVQTIDAFFQKNCIKQSYESPKIKTSSKPMLNLSAFSDDFSNSFASLNITNNLSQVIDEMISRPPNVTELNGRKLRFDDFALNLKKRDEKSIEISEHPNSNINSDELDDSKENFGLNLIKHDEPMDYFDLLVLGKTNKSKITKFKSLHMDGSATNTLSINCSTPMTINRRLSNRNISLEYNSPVESAEKSKNNSIVVTSFFAANPKDEIDLFEQSIDFRNMPDDSDSEENESNASHHNNKTSDIELDDVNDTFDRLVALA